MKVAVVEQNEILRLGLVASLSHDGSMVVTTAESGARLEDDIDVAVVSAEALRRARFNCPVVVCSDARNGWAAADPISENNVAGTLPVSTLTAAQLRATVHAAATGLRVDTGLGDGHEPELDPRALLQALRPGGQRRGMHEALASLVVREEAEALVGVEPLHLASGHFRVLEVVAAGLQPSRRAVAGAQRTLR